MIRLIAFIGLAFIIAAGVLFLMGLLGVMSGVSGGMW